MFIRTLAWMDAANFSPAQVEGYIEKATKYITDLYDAKHLANKYVATADDGAMVDDNSDDNPRKWKSSSPSKQRSKEIIDKMSVDVVRKDFYEQWAQMDTGEDAGTMITSYEEVNSQRKKAEILAEA